MNKKKEGVRVAYFDGGVASAVAELHARPAEERPPVLVDEHAPAAVAHAAAEASKPTAVRHHQAPAPRLAHQQARGSVVWTGETK